MPVQRRLLVTETLPAVAGGTPTTVTREVEVEDAIDLWTLIWKDSVTHIVMTWDRVLGDKRMVLKVPKQKKGIGQ